MNARAFAGAAALAMLLAGSACSRPVPVGALAPQAVVGARPTPFAAQFDALYGRFAELYPSFGYKGVDWSAQRDAYRARASRARSEDEFIAVAREMVEPLHDLHAYFVDPRGNVVPTYRPRHASNFDQGRWERALRDAGYVARGDIGDATVGGYAYLYLGSWKSPVDATALDLLMTRVRESPGLIIDVRTNAGGSDATALAMIARFTTRPLVVSYVQSRNGPDFSDLDAVTPRTVEPRGFWQYTRPVVVIAGRAGFSATESFVAGMRTLPNVTVIGDTTGGASGNPATYVLGNGWRFSVPRWKEYGPDGQPIEGRGVPPHIMIPWLTGHYDRDRDPLIDAAVGVLGELNGVYRMVPASGNGPKETGGDGAR